MKRIFTIVSALVIAFTFIVVVPNKVHAEDCMEKRPAGAPVLYQAVPSNGSVSLRWNPAPGPVTYYLLRYGTTKQNLEYGLPNIGGADTTNFTVAGLQNGQKYYFQVRAGNGCKPGEFSNTVTAIAGLPKLVKEEPVTIPDLSIHKAVLGASESAALLKPTAIPSSAISTTTKTVDYCAANCNGRSIIIGQLLALIIFFVTSMKSYRVRTAYSLIIPIIAVGTYYYLHGTCVSNVFWCRYFIPITVITYLFTVLIMKNRDHFRHSTITKSD